MRNTTSEPPGSSASDEPSLPTAAEIAADPACRRLIRRISRMSGVRDQDLDDVYQEVLVVVVGCLSSADTVRSRMALIATISRRRALDHLRERGRRGLVVAYDEEATPGPPSSQRIPTPDEALWLKQRAGALDDLLGRMEPELRGAFVLYELERLSLEEVARALGVRKSKARSRLRRARVRFEDLCAPVRARGGMRAPATGPRSTRPAVRRQRRASRRTGRGEDGTG